MRWSKPDNLGSNIANQARAGVLIAALLPALTACAVTTPAHITSTTGQLPQGQSVQLAPFLADDSLRGTFGRALTSALSAHDISVADGAAVVAEFAIAARDASAGVADPEASGPDGIVWSSAPRESHWLDMCSAQRLRATLIILDRLEGSIVYRGASESDVCAYTQSDLDSLAEALVADALRGGAIN